VTIEKSDMSGIGMPDGITYDLPPLKKFDISEKTGFLPEVPPLKRLPEECFSKWEDLMQCLPQFVKEKRLRDEVDKLPEVEFSEKTLHSEEEWQRAYVLVTFLGQAYIWMDGEKGLLYKVPKKIAVPWVRVSEHIGLPPVATYAAMVLYNYSLPDPSKPLDDTNVHAVSTFTDSEDESWFYMVHALVEVAAVPGLKAVHHAYSTMSCHQNSALAQDLRDVAQALQEMLLAMQKMYDHCNPKFFFVDLRPFLASSKDNDAFKDRELIFEGVYPNPPKYRGSSGAQDTAFQCFDILLGANHTGDEDKFLKEIRDYMPRKHQEYLEALGCQPSVREYVKLSGDCELIRSYNEAVDAFGEFRCEHITLVTRYIVNQRKHSIKQSLDNRGTGGTPFMIFLKKVRDDTNEMKILE